MAGIELLDAVKRLGDKDVFKRVVLEDIGVGAKLAAATQLNPPKGVAFYVTVDGRFASVLAVLALAVAAVGLVACDEAESIVIANNTSRTVVVYEDDVATELINPGLTQEFATHEFRGTLTFAVRYLCDEDVCDQTVLGERTFTWDEMQQEGGITITVGAAALGEP